MRRHSLPMLGLLLVALPATGAPFQEGEEPGPAVLESTYCARCHSNARSATAMRDARGREIGPYNLWQATMMANAARDPFWRASVSVEVAATPSQAEAIERKCLRCHAPMADTVGLVDHGTGRMTHVLDCEGRVGDLARDGVSCTICHGMTPEGFGTDESFTGGFHLDPFLRLFGPHESPFAMPMQRMAGFTPTHGTHVLESAACGTCHTLETDALDADGNLVGERHAEQTPYLEWRNSAFQDEVDPGPLAASCADCHLPTTDAEGHTIQTRIVRNPMGRDWGPTGPREPFGRHLMVGGNTQVLTMLRDHAADLSVTAPTAAFDATIAATREQLTTRTARLTLGGAERTSGRARFSVTVENFTGHKLPTGHPSRRAWLRTMVRDHEGRLLFASGRTDDRGRIVDGKGQPLAMEQAGGPLSGHVDQVHADTDVPVYQGVMKGVDGAPTHLLLRASGFWSDNRLLPRGFRRDHPDADRTAPVGTDQDPDFKGGSDVVHFDLPLAGNGPLEVEVSLMYQSVGGRWAEQLFEWETPEVVRFQEMWTTDTPGPETLATVRGRIPGR